jgi:hypothetical protein
MKRKVRKFAGGGFGDDEERKNAMRGAIMETGAFKDVDMSLVDNYPQNENREGRMSTLDPSDVEDAIRGRQMAEADQGTRVQPVPMRQPIQSTNIGESEEPGTAGFSRTPLKSASKPAVKPAVKPTPKPATQPAGQMGRTAMGKTAIQEMAAIEAGKQAKGKAEIERLKSVDKPLERVNPEASLIGGPALRGLRAAGAGLASKIAPQAAKPRVEPKIPQEAAKAAPKKPDAGYYYGAKSPKMAEKPGSMTTKPPRGGDVAKGSEQKGGQLAPKSGQLARRGKESEQLESPKRRLPYEKDMGPVEYAAAKNKRRLLDRDRRSDDVIESRKSGGKVGSASKRGDGIASRGKTRGRYI